MYPTTNKTMDNDFDSAPTSRYLGNHLTSPPPSAPASSTYLFTHGQRRPRRGHLFRLQLSMSIPPMRNPGCAYSPDSKAHYFVPLPRVYDYESLSNTTASHSSLTIDLFPNASILSSEYLQSAFTQPKSPLAFAFTHMRMRLLIQSHL
ncbi:hypothetical protein CCUS01_13139 [Colletotrichum cuscutae]|uniref:Uncharacterized protein n=1 Tax=Colletotrichum cuscutae TaxID=1209917 RepID=A0AAI9YCN1_9PEZI|nr:hypothetical protein CCUS01_13139 [Colletotrichum cuscutae]